MQNHLRTFKGSDNRFYRNELCLDTTNGPTIASSDIKQLKVGKKEEKLIKQWNTLLQHVKDTKEYDSGCTYGVYQIFIDIDTFYRDSVTNEKVWNNPAVHGDLRTLKEFVKSYYNSEIVPTLFEYEFLK